MPVYEYKALDRKGKSVTGIIDADSAVSARQKLRGTNIFPISVSKTSENAAKKDSKSFFSTQIFTRVRPAEIAMMTRQLSTLVGAGFPLVSAIDTLIPQTKSHGFKKIQAQIKDSIVEGNSFAGSLSLYPGIFSPVYINMVSAGESSGTLEIVLDRLADITEKQQALKNKILTALAYPILMTVFGSGILFFLLTYIVPNISSIFTNMGRELPTQTRILIASSDFLKSWWWGILLVFFGMIISFRATNKTAGGRHAIDKTILLTPGVGNLSRKLAVARFTRTLGSLLENGVTMLVAMDIVKNIVGNVLLSDAIEEAVRNVGKGQALAESLDKSGLFPHLAIQMIMVGEQSGELETMLGKIADVYENEVEIAIITMTALLEPVMILVMAVVVGFIVLSICLPIFQINTLIR
ncbi:type II secretion system inner membrane protein GspF [Desulfobacterales bacterium HSG16]|nr:type II secretion system inner membrane protein GspF [Desulfobacterales bacterium HSG16]